MSCRAPVLRNALRIAAALACVAWCAPALAHEADLVLLEHRRLGVVVEQSATLTPSTLLLLSPVDADADHLVTAGELQAGRAAIEAGFWRDAPLTSGEAPCALESSAAAVRATVVELTARWRCGEGQLRQRFRFLSALPAGYHVLVRAETGSWFAQGHQQTVDFTLLPDAPKGRGWLGWVRLGVEHIFMGFDHLLFVLALILVSRGWRHVLWMATAFTAAHSITLGLAALEIIPLGATALRYVEAAIALSIIWVALENLLLVRHRHRAALTFAFGLVHGFGFASVLRAYGLRDELVPGLVGFNLGVELGQACVVALAYPAVRWLQARPFGPWAVRAGSLVILAAGGFWLIDRLVG